jgi:hypothetical protein
MAVKLEIKVDNINCDAMTLHFKASSQCSLVIREQAITTDFGYREQRTLHRVEEGSTEAVGRLHDVVTA